MTKQLRRSLEKHRTPRLDDIAQRIELSATWDDLHLPEAQLRVLRDVVVHFRRVARVRRTLRGAATESQSDGAITVFGGASGTGKTMAAAILASELRLDPYRIDLSQIVSKYIGETEKNLQRIFDAAESRSVILFFDEADALFGKRSDVHDSHDRYANVEINYLLQRIESHRGLVILATSRKTDIPARYRRKVRFLVRFPRS